MSRRRGVVVLTGFMGTGKTAVGECLARRLGRRFVDTDALIEQREGCSVAEIFAARGETYFRKREREVVAEVAKLRDVVVATGGGTVVDEDNLQVLQSAGPVICLTASVDKILARTGGETRPLLTSGDRAQRVRALLAQRAPAYEKVPYRIDTSELDVAQVTDRVQAIVEASGDDPTEI